MVHIMTKSFAIDYGILSRVSSGTQENCRPDDCNRGYPVTSSISLLQLQKQYCSEISRSVFRIIFYKVTPSANRVGMFTNKIRLQNALKQHTSMGSSINLRKCQGCIHEHHGS